MPNFSYGSGRVAPNNDKITNTTACLWRLMCKIHHKTVHNYAYFLEIPTSIRPLPRFVVDTLYKKTTRNGNKGVWA